MSLKNKIVALFMALSLLVFGWFGSTTNFVNANVLSSVENTSQDINQNATF